MFIASAAPPSYSIIIQAIVSHNYCCNSFAKMEGVEEERGGRTWFFIYAQNLGELFVDSRHSDASLSCSGNGFGK